jgi:hypothetical protein
MARSQVADRGDGLQIWRVAANILNKQQRTADRGWPSSLGLGGGLTTTHRKNLYVAKYLQPPRKWTDSLARPKHRKNGYEIRLARGMSGASIRQVNWKLQARELGKYKLDPVGVQEVRWEKRGTKRAEDYTFFYGEGNENNQLETGFTVGTN